jgi:glycosyltransferase involved in cell wall biosynthesis
VTTEPTASRVPQFDLLAQRDDLELTVFYAAETVQRREWSLELRHPHEILRGPSIPTTRLLQHDYPVTPSLWRKLGRGRFDCVVVWGWSTFAAQLAIVWARTHRVPYVLFSESHDAERRTGLARTLRPLVVRPAVGGASAWLATGTLAREHLVANGADPTLVWTFANTVDVDALARRADAIRDGRERIRRDLGFGPSDVVVLHAGRLLPVKGADVLAAAAALAGEVRLLVAGEGPARAELERRAPSAVLTGFLGPDELVRAYVAADVFALLSRRETWGVVVVEAAACGLPLVLSDAVGAAADLLEDGGNGYLVPAGDVGATAQALTRLAADAETRGRFGARSRELVSLWGYGPSDDAFAAAVAAATTK